jgi:tetratricopeptide (TPR) repeat protein
MALLGKVMLSLGKESEALEWFRKVTQLELDFEGASEALVQEGRILLARRDKDGAESAFKKAALELDDPSGYFYLSQLQAPGSTEQEVYLLKAASSGIAEASHNLGSLEMERIKERKRGPESIRDFDMAKEWFQVAAAEGFGLSMLNLAMIYKAGGQVEEGEKWLEKAEELPEIREETKRVRAQWGSERVDIS